MSVTLYFCRLPKDALDNYLDDRESFGEESYPDCESIDLGVEHMAVAHLAARANRQTTALRQDPLYRMIVGTAGTPLYGDDNYPMLISREDVASASRMMNEITHDQLRGVYDLDRLKADIGEIEDWLWDAFGPGVLEERLIPMFETIRSFFSRAAQQKQQVVVSWY